MNAFLVENRAEKCLLVVCGERTVIEFIDRFEWSHHQEPVNIHGDHISYEYESCTARTDAVTKELDRVSKRFFIDGCYKDVNWIDQFVIGISFPIGLPKILAEFIKSN